MRSRDAHTKYLTEYICAMQYYWGMTLSCAREHANFARATLHKFSTGFLCKLFNPQLLHFAALIVLFLVVGSFSKRVFSYLRLLHA